MCSDHFERPDIEFNKLMGISKENFEDICNSISDDKWSSSLCKKSSIGLLLIRLRSGLSVSKIVAFTRISNYNKCIVMIQKARDSICDHFVETNLGLKNVSRGIINVCHTTELSKKLFDVSEEAILTIWDGTYVYIQKSSNYTFQRSTYSMHKYRNLVKMMMIVISTGFIIDCFGPYLANGNNNDANILKDIFDDKEKFDGFFKENDYFIVDRGFRDCVDFLEHMGMNVQIPAFLNGSKQHTDKESNESRLITKIRWVVESVNGQIKKWEYFKNTVSNVNIKYLFKDFRIVCTLINKYLRPRTSSTIDDAQIAMDMLNLADQNNQLKAKIEQIGKEKSKKINDVTQIKFPRITEDYIRQLTFGVYQLKQAKSYNKEQIDENGLYKYQFIGLEKNIIKVRIHSRHSGSLVYSCFIELNINDENNPINAWYCSCKCGSRVVGTCAHITSVIWYLVIGQHDKSFLEKKRADLFIDFCLDAKK